MPAVILAAEKTLSVSSHVGVTPKAMVRVENRPILEHALNKLPNHIQKVAIIVGYRGDIIRRYFGEIYGGRQLYYVWQYQHGANESALRRAAKILRTSEFLIIDLKEIIKL